MPRTGRMVDPVWYHQHNFPLSKQFCFISKTFSFNKFLEWNSKDWVHSVWVSVTLANSDDLCSSDTKRPSSIRAWSGSNTATSPNVRPGRETTTRAATYLIYCLVPMTNRVTCMYNITCKAMSARIRIDSLGATGHIVNVQHKKTQRKTAIVILMVWPLTVRRRTL